MTVICYRDGVMAADSAGWIGDIKSTFQEQKVRRCGPSSGGGLAAASGPVSHIELFHEWLARGAPQTDKPFEGVEEGCFGALHVPPSGTIVHYDHALRPYQTSMPFAVEGSHDEFMLALMLSGHSATSAVELAIKHCRYAGGQVQSLRLSET